MKENNASAKGFIEHFHTLMQPLEYQEHQSSGGEKQSLTPGAAIYATRSPDRVDFCGKIVKATMKIYETFLKDHAWMAMLNSQLPVSYYYLIL